MNVLELKLTTVLVTPNGIDVCLTGIPMNRLNRQMPLPNP
jgi:hypothetical protein